MVLPDLGEGGRARGGWGGDVVGAGGVMVREVALAVAVVFQVPVVGYRVRV